MKLLCIMLKNMRGTLGWTSGNNGEAWVKRLCCFIAVGRYAEAVVDTIVHQTPCGEEKKELVAVVLANLPEYVAGFLES